MTTQILLEEWLENCKKNEVKARTYSRYYGLIKMHILPVLGGRTIEDIGRRDIQEFITQQRKDGNIRSGEKLSSSSTNMMLCVLNLAFEYACDMEYIDENPCSKVRRTKTEVKKVEAFTLDEQKKLEEEIIKSGDRRFNGILICLYTGLRIGELLELTWDDIDFEKGILRISRTVYREKDETGTWKLFVDTPKTTASERIVPLPEYIIDLLKEDYKCSRTQFVVENKKNERMSIRSYQYLFAKLTEKAGVRKLNFHALRHTFATRAIECGIDVKTVAEIMGHRNASITLNRYVHCMLEHKIEMMKKLPRAL